MKIFGIISFYTVYNKWKFTFQLIFCLSKSIINIKSLKLCTKVSAVIMFSKAIDMKQYGNNNFHETWANNATYNYKLNY